MISRSTLGPGRAGKNLAQLKEDFPVVEGGMLEQNYRSTKPHPQPPNTCIATNPHVC